MNNKLSKITLSTCCALIFFLNSCATTNQLTSIEAAERFALAINHHNVQELLELSELPFYVDNQDWESAADGIGFLLGERNRLTIDTAEELSTYLVTLIEKLELSGTDGMYIHEEEYSRFREELGPTTLSWQPYDAYLFLRGMSDVEHIVILGVNKSTNKIARLYFN
jgi:hypothetical protein